MLHRELFDRVATGIFIRLIADNPDRQQRSTLPTYSDDALRAITAAELFVAEIEKLEERMKERDIAF